ncbi:O-acetyltransferase [Gautieria morchelliformis]|nr:O-acetyltransferase [Gautieria morchelliformis]
MPSSKRFAVSANPALPHWIAAGAIAATVAAGLLRYIFIDWSDPYRCGSLLREGRWLDDSFSNWQPDGCMLHNYGRKDVSTCLSSRRMVFIGDSVTRQLFFTVAHMADSTLPSQPPNDEQKHADHTLSSEDLTEFAFVWDPFLNTTRTKQMLHLADDEANMTSSPASIRTPAMIVIGSGLWFLRYAESSGGLPRWEATIEDTLDLIAKAGERLADKIVFLPVEDMASSKLSPPRASSMHNSDVDAMNADLKHRIDPLSTKYLPAPSQLLRKSTSDSHVTFPQAFNKMLDPSMTADGLHYSDKVLKAQANVLLNLRCNEVLPKTFPLDKTCCRSYPSVLFYQILVIVVLVSWGPIARLAASELAQRPKLQAFFPGEDHIMPLTIFGMAVFLIFVADRTPIWLKEQKQYDPWVFGSWIIFVLVTGLLAMKRADKDLGFLNREQTDEWKGWMQIMILIYHYFGASKISGIYNPIRVLVAAYLFMTGYGHTTFYIKKADYGLLRVAQVMVRLNLLPIALAYTMNTNYLSYYFSPLVSMWFIIIYITMAVGKSLNDRSTFLIVKFLISMALVGLLMSQNWILEALFVWLSRLCGIRWNATEWAFRVKLDLWIIYFGMFTALAHIKFRELRLIEHPRWSLVHRVSIGLSTFGLVWFFIFELSQPSKFVYNHWHPYISVIPIGAFVILRNSNAILRSASSRMFAFIGTCSLETFIIQFHFWLAADTKGILLVIPGSKWRPLNMLVSTVMFIWLSHKVASATGDLTNWFCGTPKKALPLPPSVTPRPSGPTVTSARADEIALLRTDKSGVAESRGTAAPAERWVDRLANGTRANSAPGFRMFEGDDSYWPANWQPGIGTRLAAAGLILWVVNITWPS